MSKIRRLNSKASDMGFMKKIKNRNLQMLPYNSAQPSQILVLIRI